jgi:hypothetical protein
VGSLNFNQSSGRSLKPFASPLFLVAMSIIYGVLFMVMLALNYEYHLHHPNDPRSYTRFQHTRNQSLGFGALLDEMKEGRRADTQEDPDPGCHPDSQAPGVPASGEAPYFCFCIRILPHFGHFHFRCL